MSMNRTIALILRSSLISAALSSPVFAATLHVFTGQPDGALPEAPLVSDSRGNLFGSTSGGGAYGGGTVFVLSPAGVHAYVYHILYSFQTSNDAWGPRWGLLLDEAGNLYGTSQNGGAKNRGAIFELSPTAQGWSEKVIYSFGGSGDASNPLGELIMDAAGNLYGAANGGGPQGLGAIFRLSPDGAGGWSESVIYGFTNDGVATYPSAGLVEDRAGNLFGPTSGGPEGLGAIFELTPTGSGNWIGQVIHSFTGRDGCNPQSKLLLDAAGNLYGATTSLRHGGSCDNRGTVFELSPTTDGTWTEALLHSFSVPTDGAFPFGITIDAVGNLYGTTWMGGSDNLGTVFELVPHGNGLWSEHVLHTFTKTEGGNPQATVVFGVDGLLYGTAEFYGGSSAKGFGTVYELSPHRAHP